MHFRVQKPAAGLLLAVCCALLAVLRAMAAETEAFPGRRVLFVNSYHPGYAWSDGEQRGAEKVLKTAGAELRVAYLDTKRRPDTACAQAAAVRVLAEIAAFRPEVVIAADDNAQSSLVVPYLKDGDIPVVFCGVNWDASRYGYPVRNVTGMVEVEAIRTLVKHLRQFAQGDRIGFLADDTVSERMIFAEYNTRFFGGRLRGYLARDFAEYKRLYLRAQTEADMLIIQNNGAILDWDDVEARRFFAANARTPSGSSTPHMAPYAMITVGKVPEEQGEWAARMALDILAGVPPAAIPISWNDRVRLVVNLDMARATGVVLPVSLLRAAAEILGHGSGEADDPGLAR